MVFDGIFADLETRRVAIDAVGYLAGATTVAAFYCRKMLSLRFAAIMANVLFILYGWLLDLKPVLVLHLLLLPLNITRMADAWRERVSQLMRAGSDRPV